MGCIKKAFFNVESDEICFCKGFAPVSHKSVHFTGKKYRSILIDISLLCQETDITSFVNSLDDMNKLF